MAEAQAAVDVSRYQLQIPITKAGGTITVDTRDVEAGGDMSAEVYREALIQGLKVILNRGMAKITKEAYTTKDGTVEEAKMKAAAMAKAEATFDSMKKNEIRFMGEKVAKGKVSGEVMTEARRIARNYVKEGLKAEGHKIAHFDAKEITRAANEMIADNPQILEEAQAAVAARKEAAKGSGVIDIKKFASTLKANPKLIAAAEKEKAERKTQASAAKAGKTVVRSNPKTGPQATAH